MAGTTFLIALDVPPSGGGDTVFASSVVACDRLSQEFRQRLHGIKIYHDDGLRLESPAREAGSIVRYKPGSSIHPLIRTHPVSSYPLSIDTDNRLLERNLSLSVLISQLISSTSKNLKPFSTF
jgi:alpha-ketoglutarate-dependent taurine dioxygenase